MTMISRTSNSNQLSTQSEKMTWTITIGNINSFPHDLNGSNKYKLDKIRQILVNNDSDILMISEHNKNIDTIPYWLKPATIIKRWWKNTIVRSSHLTSESKSQFEPGGTMIVTHSRSSAHTCDAGQDLFQLGRWNYITLKGKNGKLATLISIYRPNKGQETYLRQTAYSAKRRKVLTNDQSPEMLWFADLRALIVEKQAAGHEVLVAGDFNDDLNNSAGKIHIFMTELGLREILNERYGPGPATYIRGTKKIDGVYATYGLHIESGSYTTFDESPSDHRWIVLNIFEETLIGSSRNDLSPPLLRKTTSKIPSVKQHFQDLLDAQVKKYRLKERMDNIYNAILHETVVDQQWTKEYEIVETRMKRAVKYADANCRKVRKGHIPFSPVQKQLMGKISILHQLKLRFLLKGKLNRPRSQKIKRMIKKYKYTGKTRFESMEEIEKTLAESVKEYGVFRKRASECRWEYIHNIATELGEQSNHGREHHFKILQHREITKEHFQRIKKAEGKIGKAGVDRIQIDDDEQGTTRITYDKHTIEEEIMKVNKEKLLQAATTPLRHGELSILLGEQGDFEKWESILKKCIHLPMNAEDDIRLWYEYITNYEQHKPSDFMWTTEEYVNSWKRMKEDKTTLPGIQVAHIKCLEPHSMAADVMSKLALIPLMTGYSPVTWRQGIDSMIPKKTADLRPAKLRLILLMDARFNHNNKLIGKKMMEYGEKHGLLASEQYGSRKQKSSIDHAANKRLSMDILRQSGTNAIYIANDAKACYDRIILMVAYLTMRNFGIPAKVALSTIYTVLNMKHFVRTKYGDSENYYGGDKWDIKPHGCGQGNGYGPALWACISSPLLFIMRQANYGATLKSPVSRTSIRIAAFAFVDDVDMIQTEKMDEADHEFSVESLYQDTQKGFNLWNGLLRITGGDLETSKTFFIPIIHKWQGPNKALDTTMNHHLYMKQGEGNDIPLTQKDPYDSFFSLGIWQSPSGNDNKQKERLIDQIRQWDTSTTNQKLTWLLARLALMTTIGRTLLYPLPATALTQEQCREIQRVYLKSVLGKIGIVRTAPRILAEVPTSLGGLGLIAFEAQQLISHISLILIHGPDKTTITHDLLRSTLEYYALETGLPGDPLGLPNTSYVTKNTWIGQTLASMRKFNINIHSDIPGLDKWGIGDSFIMAKLQYLLSPNTLSMVNKVRMYLRVVTFSDLLSADGNTYDMDILKGNRGLNNPSPSYYRYDWPKAQEPTRHEKQVWHHSICLAYNITLAISDVPAQKIQWYRRTKEWAKWLISHESNQIYERIAGNKWNLWSPIETNAAYSTRSNTGNFSKLREVMCIPDETVIISIHRRNRYISIASEFIGEESPDHTPKLQLPYSISNVQSHVQESFFCYHISLHNGIIISDGSYNGTKASFAYIAQPITVTVPLQQVEFETILHGTGDVFGSTGDVNAYRAELTGILAAITFTNTICTKFNIKNGTCTMYCDNKGALSASFGHKKPTPRWSSYDLVRQIRQAIFISPIRWKHQHVLGHQDEGEDFLRLDPMAQGNVMVDFLASSHLQHSSINTPFEPLPWTPYIGPKVICGNIEKTLLIDIYRRPMIQFWSRKLNIPDNMIDQCDWDSYFRSVRTQSSRDRPNILKYNSRLLPVGKNLKRRRHSDYDMCPCCGEMEDHDHVYQCSHPEMEKVFREQLNIVTNFLLQDTVDEIRSGVLTLLTAFRHNCPPENATQVSSSCIDQYNLGKRAFLAGLWLTSWKVYQTQFFAEHNPRKSAELWMVRLLHLVQCIPVKLWKQRNVLATRSEAFVSKAHHKDLDTLVDQIFSNKPHSRCMAHCDVAFFRKYDKEHVKKFKIHRKNTWITSANLILTKYERVGLSEQSKRFFSFFQWDRG